MNADDHAPTATDAPEPRPTPQTCPCCSNGPYDDLDGHWRRASECNPPTLTPQQTAIAHGVLLAGGTLLHDDENAHLSVEAESEQVVRWLASAFGVNSWGITNLSGGHRWRSRATPAFTELAADWMDDGVVAPPTKLPTTPDAVRTAYALVGELRELNGTPRPVLTPPTTTVRAIERLCSPFHPMVFEESTGDAVYVQATEDFFRYVGAPLPGCATDWPEHPTLLDPTPERCPHCLNEFEYIEAHWRACVACSPPLLSWKQHEFAEGVLLGGGRLELAEGGHRLLLHADEIDILAGLDETFGVLSAGIHETADGPVWYSRATPELSRFARWLDEEGRMRVPADLNPSERMLKLAYGLAGEFVDGQPKFRFRHAIESDAFAESFFEDFDPMSTPSGVVLRDVSGFFQFVGWIPLPGRAEKWP